jgi:hypothetical protein
MLLLMSEGPFLEKAALQLLMQTGLAGVQALQKRRKRQSSLVSIVHSLAHSPRFLGRSLVVGSL